VFTITYTEHTKHLHTTQHITYNDFSVSVEMAVELQIHSVEHIVDDGDHFLGELLQLLVELARACEKGSVV